MDKKTKKQSKTATVTRMLTRGNGATLAEIVKSTGWKEHSCRALLTGIRKKAELVKGQRPDGTLAYRMQTTPAAVSAE
jgi:hypothetical protein